MCSPSSILSGGAQSHIPDWFMEIWSVTGSDSRVIVTVVPGGPSPKNSGEVVVTTSPSSTLSRVTCSLFSPELVVLRPEEEVGSGISRDDSGNSSVPLGETDLKSWLWPSVMGGIGFADSG